MYKRPFILAFLAVMAVAVLPSCGGGGGGLNVSNTSSSTASSALTSVASISAGDGHTLAVSTTGAMYSWGEFLWGRLGLGSNIQADKTSPAQIGTLSTWSSVSAGGAHSLALLAAPASSMWAWGYNSNGQLGDGTSNDSYVPILVGGSSNKWLAVGAGNMFSAAIKADGSLFTWGQNVHGQLGTNDNLDRSVPTSINPATLKNWSKIAVGANHVIGLRNVSTTCSSQVFSWGAGNRGQLGQFASGDMNVPTCMTLLTSSAIAVAAGGVHSLAIDTNHDLWAWGGNDSGQVGNGSTVDLSIPAIITDATPNLPKWKAIAAGGSHSVGIREGDGSLWTWGSNVCGQLGNGLIGASTNVTVPTRVGTSQWLQVAAGKNHTVAIRADGTMWVWGCNDAGQLGNGTTTTTAVSIP